MHAHTLATGARSSGVLVLLLLALISWTEKAELAASDPAAYELLGTSVSVSGGTAIVGAPGQLESPTVRGTAHVFVQEGITWAQQAELTASDGSAEDMFGAAVSVSDGIAVVGAPNRDAQAGAAYVFAQSGTTWTQVAELTASDGAAGDAFGLSVAVSGGTAIVGAPNHEVGGKVQAGAAYVFAQSGTTWTQVAELTASDGGKWDTFGNAVAVSGGTAVVGACGHAVGPLSLSGAGAAYVFVQSGTTWTQQAELTASDGDQDDELGWSVAVSGGTAVAGAIMHQVGDKTEAGAAYVFVQSGTTWTQQAELTASDAEAYDELGISVAVSGGVAVAGAPFHPGNSDSAAGAAWVFAQDGAGWTQQGELTPSDGATQDWFGSSVSVSGSAALVGSPNHSVDVDLEGAAYVFDATCAGMTDGSPCPGGACEAGVCAPLSDGDAGTTSSGSSSSSGGSSPGETGDGDGGIVFGGCGCVTAPRPSPPLGLAAIGALLGLGALGRSSSARRRRTAR